MDLMLAYTRVKDGFLRVLHPTSAWHQLDHPRTFRAAAKRERLDGVPAHIQDQAMFEVVHTMRRCVQSAVANTHVKAKVFARFGAAKRHDAFWILPRYAPIGAALRGEALDPTPPPGVKGKGIALCITERKEVVRFLRRTSREALGKPPRVHHPRSFALDSTRYSAYRYPSPEGRPGKQLLGTAMAGRSAADARQRIAGKGS